MNESDAFLALLRRDGVVHAPDARLTPLSGGVSCEIYLVEDGAERFVAKRALAKLSGQGGLVCGREPQPARMGIHPLRGAIFARGGPGAAALFRQRTITSRWSI